MCIFINQMYLLIQQQQPFISTLSTANSNNYQPASVSAPVVTNGTEEEPEAKIPKLEGIVF